MLPSNCLVDVLQPLTQNLWTMMNCVTCESLPVLRIYPPETSKKDPFMGPLWLHQMVLIPARPPHVGTLPASWMHKTPPWIWPGANNPGANSMGRRIFVRFQIFQQQFAENSENQRFQGNNYIASLHYIKLQCLIRKSINWPFSICEFRGGYPH